MKKITQIENWFLKNIRKTKGTSLKARLLNIAWLAVQWRAEREAVDRIFNGFKYWYDDGCGEIEKDSIGTASTLVKFLHHRICMGYYS